MAATPSRLIEIGTRHQVHLERVKSHDAAEFAAFLKRMDRDTSRQLAGRNLSEFTIKRLNRLIAAINESLSGAWKDYEQVFRKQIAELAAYEAQFEARALNQVVNYDFTLPAPRQLEAAVYSRPLSVAGPDKGKLLEPFFRDWSAKTYTRVEGAIRLGYAQGQTTNQILQTIRGTRAGRFQDGLLAMTNRDAEMMTRTALQHAASTSREAVWKDNADIVKKVRWVSTLDSRTTPQCQSLDGTEWPIDSGPRPPLHIGCRSAIVGVLDERFAFLREGATRAARDEGGVTSVGAKTTYFEWLKTQPSSFIDSAIGPKRGKLLRGGGLSAERFAELQLGRQFQPLSLNDMRKLEPAAFERAGL